MKGVKDVISVRGFSRVRIGHMGKDNKLVIDGDSGWMGPNQVVNEGFQDYICKLIGKLGGSKQVEYINVGTGTAPGAAANTLEGETGTRKTTSNSVIASKTLQSTQAFASGDHPGGTPTLKNIGLFNTASGGSLLCGNTYAVSTWQANQGVSCTYQLRFGTS